MVTLVVAILAALALPNLRGAMFKADAAHIMSDANTVALAAFEHLADHGTFPGSGGVGSPPAALEPYLPENFTFSYRPDVPYYWFSIRFPDADNYWETRELGVLMIFYPAGSGIATAMRGHQGPFRYWGDSWFYLLYPN